MTEKEKLEHFCRNVDQWLLIGVLSLCKKKQMHKFVKS